MNETIYQVFTVVPHEYPTLESCHKTLSGAISYVKKELLGKYAEQTSEYCWKQLGEMIYIAEYTLRP